MSRHICLSLRFSVLASLHISAFSSFCPPFMLPSRCLPSVFPSFYLFVFSSFGIPVLRSFYLYVYPSSCLFIFPYSRTFRLSIFLSFRHSVCTCFPHSVFLYFCVSVLPFTCLKSTLVNLCSSCRLQFLRHFNGFCPDDERL